jgi:Uma2 family endonuclease
MEAELMERIESPPKTETITGEEFLAMGDIGSCELIDGRIVYMSPAGDEHGIIESNLAFELKQFARQHKRGRVMTGEVGIYIRRNPDRVRGADVILVSYEKLPKPTGKFLDVAPELAVEIMSPNDRWEEVREKIRDYFSIGIEQVWIVEPGNRKLLVYHSNTDLQEFGEGDTIEGEGILAGFTLNIDTLFTADI